MCLLSTYLGLVNVVREKDEGLYFPRSIRHDDQIQAGFSKVVNKILFYFSQLAVSTRERSPSEEVPFIVSGQE